MAVVEIMDLLNAGAHFGHLTRRWNPKMRQYIFMERNGIHIIDLKKTQHLLSDARNAVERFASDGRKVLFIGTKKQAREIIKSHAERVGANYVIERWLGGMLTNFSTIRKSIKRLNTIEKMDMDGTMDKLRKKERLMIGREKERLVRVLGGISEMTRLPGCLFIVDIKKEHLAIKEAKTLGIPIIAITDTNTDPTLIDFPIPANDDSQKTIDLITGVIAEGVANGYAASRTRQAEMNADDDRDMKENETENVDDAKTKVRKRARKPRGNADSATEAKA